MSKIIKLVIVFSLLNCSILTMASYSPAVSINSPKAGQSFFVDQEIEFTGIAVDPDGDKILADNIKWSSDLDGFLFKGLNGKKKLSRGEHIITMTATDSERKSSSKCTFVRIKNKILAPVDSNESNKKVSLQPKTEVKPEQKKYMVKGLCYGPFRDNQDPDKGVFPSIDEINSDLEFISKVTNSIRTYGSSDNPEKITEICCKYKIKCSLGVWLSKYNIENRKEIESAIKLSNSGLDCLDFVIVGNEVLLRQDMSEKELIAFIREVKNKVKVPVTTADTWAVWKNSPYLASEVDYILVHIHPYWEGVNIEDAAKYVIGIYHDLKALYPNKKIVIGETGWPSKGESKGNAVPSPENQKKFFAEFTELAEKEGIEYYYFSCFDEKWKSRDEGKVGGAWGIFNSDGTIKPLLKNILPKEIGDGMQRPPGKLEKTEASLPLVIYTDASEKCAFQPSGWVGDLDCINVVRDCTDLPYSGKTCIMIEYKTRGILTQGWAGVYWQYPINNWGEYPGYNIQSAKKLTFWARGKNGAEKSELKWGGIKDGKNSDTFGPISTGVITLSKEWQKYEISLSGANLSNVIGGFCWVTNYQQNPNGCVIYLEDIIFE